MALTAPTLPDRDFENIELHCKSPAMASTSSSSSSSDAEQPATTKRKVEDSESEDDSDSSSDSSDSEAEDVEPAEEDVPVLSHAKLRRQKKKEAKTKKPADDAEEPSIQGKKVPKVKNTAELAPSKVPKRQNSVWVGNLSFKTTPDALRQFFDGVGEITRVHMPIKMASGGPGGRGAVKENRGLVPIVLYSTVVFADSRPYLPINIRFAYVDFATPDAKNIAIAMSENHLEGRRLLIKDGTPFISLTSVQYSADIWPPSGGDFTGRPSSSAQPSADGAEGADNKLTGHTKTAQKILRQQKQPAGPTLFLGNLSFEATEQGIQNMLESHRGSKEVKPEDGMDVDGENEKAVPKKKWIRKIRMGTFEDSGKCKGYVSSWFLLSFLMFTVT